MTFGIVDSHIHLFAENGSYSLRWMEPGHKLQSDHTEKEYLENDEHLSPDFRLEGYVVIEADAETRDRAGPEGWKPSIEECKFFFEHESNRPDSRMLGAMPWAPMVDGKEAVNEYHTQLMNSMGPKSAKLIKGYRYLVQDKPDGQLLLPHFIESFQWLADNDLAFDMGIDAHLRGFKQFEELEQLLKKTSGLTIMLNHLAKLNLDWPMNMTFFSEWCERMDLLLLVANLHGHTIYVKFSGAFDELDEETAKDDTKICSLIVPYLKYLLENWDHHYIIWGSNWPVCTVKGGPVALKRWVEIVWQAFDQLEVSTSVREDIMRNNNRVAYRL